MEPKPQPKEAHEIWADEFNFGKYHVKKVEKPSCHYFDTEVYMRKIKMERQNLFLTAIKKLFGFMAVLIILCSCNRYAYERGGTCGVWYPKKYSGAAKPVKSYAYRYR